MGCWLGARTLRHNAPIAGDFLYATTITGGIFHFVKIKKSMYTRVARPDKGGKEDKGGTQKVRNDDEDAGRQSLRVQRVHNITTSHDARAARVRTHRRCLMLLLLSIAWHARVLSFISMEQEQRTHTCHALVWS